MTRVILPAGCESVWAESVSEPVESLLFADFCVKSRLFTLLLCSPAAANQEEARWKLLRHQQHSNPHVCGCHHPRGEASVQRDSHAQVNRYLHGKIPLLWPLVPCTHTFLSCFLKLAVCGRLLAAHNRGGERTRGERTTSSVVFIRFHVLSWDVRISSGDHLSCWANSDTWWSDLTRTF